MLRNQKRKILSETYAKIKLKQTKCCQFGDLLTKYGTAHTDWTLFWTLVMF